eukprot:7194998-Prymnesium_polylepis.1
MGGGLRISRIRNGGVCARAAGAPGCAASSAMRVCMRASISCDATSSADMPAFPLALFVVCGCVARWMLPSAVSVASGGGSAPVGH